MAQLRRHCPFCLERTGSVGSRENVSINTEKGVYYCWRCGANGHLNKWSADRLGVSEYGNHVPDLDTIIYDKEPEEDREFPVGYVPLYPWRDVRDSIVLRRYIRYLQGRGVTPKTMKRFKLGVVLDPPRDMWYTKGNIVYPVLDGERKGYVRRRIDGDGYFNSKGLTREDAFYNGRIIKRVDSLYVVEGPHDVLAMRMSAIGSLGTSVTDKQLERLSKAECKVIFAMDGDAWRVSMVLARRLTLRGKDAYWTKIPSGLDPGKLGYDNVAKLPTYGF